MNVPVERYIFHREGDRCYRGYLCFAQGTRFDYVLKLKPYPLLITVKADRQTLFLTEAEKEFFMRQVRTYAENFRKNPPNGSYSRRETSTVLSGRMPRKFIDAIFAQ